MKQADWFAAIAAAEPRKTEAPPVAAGEASKEEAKENAVIVAPAGEARNKLPISAPAPLADLKAWLVWRFVQKAGKAKPDKVPFYAASRKGRRDNGTEEDRAQLVDFATARAAAERHGFHGVGLATLPDWGITALDFDGCVEPDGAVNSTVLRLCSGTYAELSPSGTGIRAFVRADTGSQKDLERVDGFKFETFFDSGFVTYTGNALPLVGLLGLEDTIAPASDAVLAYCEKRFGRVPTPAMKVAEGEGEKPIGLTAAQIDEVLSRLDPEEGGYHAWLHRGMALHHETGGEGFDLWDNWSSKGASYPGTDALQRHWDSFGRGGHRPKTMHALVNRANELGAGINLAEKSIDDFDDLSGGPMAELQAQDKPLRFAVVPGREFVQRPAPSWLVKGVVPQAELLILFGESGAGKSFVALDLFGAVARPAREAKARGLHRG